MAEKKETIAEQIKNEEESFFTTIASGLELFEKELPNTKETFSGEVAFKLYDTYGFPLDLTADMLREKGLSVNEAEFEHLMAEQKARSKASWKGSGDKATQGDFKPLLEKFGHNAFVGYTHQRATGKILALLDENFKEVQRLEENGWVMFDQTPFYAMSGGQSGDEGIVEGYGKVLDTKKFFDLNLSLVELEKPLHVGDTVNLVVDTSRLEIEKHHSATHLLHSALRKVLGEHVSQAGSLVEKDRLRFDFSHPKALNSEELTQIEAFVNAVVASGVEGITRLMNVDEAKKSGAMALFGEKYGNEVRVVSFGDASVELCGGTHVRNTAHIGSFFILKESGVSAGVRRIEAVCGGAALAYAQNMRSELEAIKESVKHKEPLIGINRLKEEVKALKSEVESLNAQVGKAVESL